MKRSAPGIRSVEFTDWLAGCGGRTDTLEFKDRVATAIMKVIVSAPFEGYAVREIDYGSRVVEESRLGGGNKLISSAMSTATWSSTTSQYNHSGASRSTCSIAAL